MEAAATRARYISFKCYSRVATTADRAVYSILHQTSSNHSRYSPRPYRGADIGLSHNRLWWAAAPYASVPSKIWNFWSATSGKFGVLVGSEHTNLKFTQAFCKMWLVALVHWPKKASFTMDCSHSVVNGFYQPEWIWGYEDAEWLGSCALWWSICFVLISSWVLELFLSYCLNKSRNKIEHKKRQLIALMMNNNFHINKLSWIKLISCSKG